MKQTTWPDQKVQEALKRFVVYNVNVDRERKIAEQCGVRTIPTYGIYDVSGNTIKPVKVISGSRPPDEFLEWLGKE